MAKGSHSTYGGWEPKTCYLCGGKITLSGAKATGAMFSFRGGKPRSRHADCRPPR